MSAQPQPLPPQAASKVEFSWDATAVRAPQMVATMASYLDQLAVSSRPGTVEAYELTLRQFAGQLVEHDPTCRSVGKIERRHIEHYKLWMRQRRRPGGSALSAKTIRHKLGLVRVFFERIIEWGYDDAPDRVPIFPGDLPES